MLVKPFRGLRPRAELIARIPSLPYDVLDSEEARVIASGDPYTFLHVVKSEIDLDPSVDPHDDRVYSKARQNFDAMRASGWLVPDPKAAFYVYRLGVGDHIQTGVVGAASVDDYLERRIKRHEHTRPDKEDDRARHTEALGAHPGPVFLAYRRRAGIDQLVAEATASPAAADFTAVDGVRHTLWVVDDPAAVRRFESAFSDVPASYIADGHHRAAAYVRVAQLRRQRTGNGAGTRPFDSFLAVHFPAEELRILDYNRLVRDLNGLGVAKFLMRVQEAGFDLVTPWVPKRPPGRGSFGLYVDGDWRLLQARSGIVPAADPVRSLDVAVLQDRLLGPVLGIGDPRTDPRVAFVGGIRGVNELERRVDSGRDAVAFALAPTSIDDVMRVADAGDVMPPKSTWFEPKLRSGMVVHALDLA